MNKITMIDEINKWKKDNNAIILAHYYQNDEVQDIADYVGDSLALAQIASKTKADIIVFCGVHFMAETAKILCPDKKVLFPVMDAGCSMANMIDSIKLMDYKKKNPDTIIITYVNSTASVKALSDVCVTSSNAINIIKHYASMGKKMLYCPDQNLGKYAMKLLNINFEVWNGFCYIHNDLTTKEVLESKNNHPNASFIAHPECRLEILELADYVGSTKQLIEYVTESNHEEFIIGTEEGVIYEMQKRNPNKKFYPVTSNFKCPDMKLTNLNDIYDCITNMKNEIIMDEKIMKDAKNCLDNMLKLS